jgi:hypothetical protein
MNVLKQMSDDEISFAIRYLDPDLDRSFQYRKAEVEQDTAHDFALATAGSALYILLLRWLPALVRLMR